ncbi:MAG: hypothetical protein IBX36_02570 [Dehalococcoidia bacterium]|nr:hypothetical protein [Dehalococcoidia bacterium]
MLKLALEYFLFIFLASLGVLQIVASYDNLRGLSFFSRPTWGYIFGSLAVVGGFSWFYIVANPHPEVAYAITFGDIFHYGWSNPKLADIGLIMGEGECVVFFLLALVCALLTTFLISSMVKSKIAPSQRGVHEGSVGLEALREMTFFQAVRRSLRKRKE